MSARSTLTAVAAVKLVIFTAVSLVVTSVLAMIMGNFGFGSTTEYRVMFSSASMISSGDDVRIAGITVGSVSDVEIVDRSRARVTIKVRSNVPLTESSGARIQFLNLVGTRYLALVQGAPGAPRLAAGSTIPMSRTEPALDLTELFNGFQPLFSALDPQQINDLSLNLVKVLQGEGGTVSELLSRTASLTNTLADRDELIGDVITNLSAMLSTVDDHRRELSTLVVQMRGWLGGLARDRKTLGSSLKNISDLSGELADVLTQGRPFLKDDIAQIRRIAATMAKPQSQKLVDEMLTRLPVMFRRQTRIGTYGSWYNYYLCDVEASIKLPRVDLAQLAIPNLTGPILDQIVGNLTNMNFHSTAERCS
ncbi:phospholipid/cholesterol/gamma-HCH transport system substrate-binding protein [Marmoricola sp. OAE513]|uniref:MCE family protein n=1 Tax=Marmoricola sp. OAE513 TaxID=2817894 RepID=UPI001AE2190B